MQRPTVFDYCRNFRDDRGNIGEDHWNLTWSIRIFPKSCFEFLFSTSCTPLILLNRSFHAYGILCTTIRSFDAIVVTIILNRVRSGQERENCFRCQPMGSFPPCRWNRSRKHPLRSVRSDLGVTRNPGYRSQWVLFFFSLICMKHTNNLNWKRIRVSIHVIGFVFLNLFQCRVKICYEFISRNKPRINTFTHYK